jgi:hypothetical protein
MNSIQTTTIIDELRTILLNCPIENTIDLRITCSRNGFKSNISFKYGIRAQRKYPTLIESLEATFNAFYKQLCDIATDLPNYLNTEAQWQTGDLSMTWTKYKNSPECKHQVEHTEKEWERKIIEIHYLVNTISLCQELISNSK